MSEILLSICIPTYNRCDKVCSIVQNCLSSKNMDFEIIVSDNCSTDDTVEKLKSINDKRLIILESDKNYGTYVNGNKALLAGKGKYIMPFMDRDNINMKYFDIVLDYLQKHDFAAGVLTPDYSSDDINFFIYSSKIDALRFCARGNHPSGFLYNRKLVQEHKIFDICSNYDEKIRAFSTDFISTILCEYGDIALLNVPFTMLGQPPFDDAKHSNTYSQSKKNVFFMPWYRFSVFEVYLDFLDREVKLSFSKRLKLIKTLLKDLYVYSTDWYLSILNNKNICEWYALSEDFVENEKARNLKVDYLMMVFKSEKFYKMFVYFLAAISFYFWFRKNKTKTFLQV